MHNSLNRPALTSIVLFALVTALPFPAQAEPGVFDDRIVFGQSAAFKGSAAALGLGMRQGILTAFEEANAAGGVNGRKLELVSYSGSRSSENVGLRDPLAIGRTQEIEVAAVLSLTNMLRKHEPVTPLISRDGRRQPCSAAV